MKFKIPLIFKLIITLILIFLIFVFGSKAWKDYQVKQDESKREAMYTQILDGATAKPITLNVDYTNKISNGSALIFGGNHAPDDNQQDAWNKIAKVGLTSIRKDMFVESPLPANITLDDYKNNLGDLQNPDNWDTTTIARIRSYYANAHKRGIKTIGIIAYSPAWLNYSKYVWGVPKDMNVYEDLVKKTYKLYRNDLDFVEVWNEPNFDVFFHTEGSGMTKDQAYKQLFIHAVKAVREVDSEANDGKIIPIMGPAGFNPMLTSTIDTILSDPITRDKLQIVTYHNYDAQHLKEPSWVNYKKVMEKYGKQDLPVFITEWNSEPETKTFSLLNTSNSAIPYTGDKFVSFLKMGLAGANYHVIEALDLKKPNNGEGYMGFYRWVDGKAELLPQAKTWRLMSNKMMLGKGPSFVYGMDLGDSKLNGVGFKNSAGQDGAVVVNRSSDSQLVSMTFKNINVSKYAKVSIYNASADNDATSPVYEGEVKVNDHGTTLLVYVPKEAVIGLTLSEDKTWYDFLNLPY